MEVELAPSLGLWLLGRSLTAIPFPVPGDRMPPPRVGLWSCDWGMNDRLPNKMQLRERLADRTICWCPEYPPSLGEAAAGWQEKFQDLSPASVSGFLRAACSQTCSLTCCPPRLLEPQECT